MIKEETLQRIRQFSIDRDWSRFHTPSNLAKSITIEASELLECFQWSDENYNLEHVKEEIADVLVYVIDLFDTFFTNLFFLNFFTSLSVKRILLIRKPTFFVFIIHKNIPNGKTLFF